jgi:hypothetical protein
MGMASKQMTVTLMPFKGVLLEKKPIFDNMQATDPAYI